MAGRGKALNAFTKAGLGLYAAYGLVNHLVYRLPHFLALPVLLASIALLLAGAYRWRQGE